MKATDFHSLEQLTENIKLHNYNLAEIRMLLLYFDRLGKIGELYNYVKANKNSLDLKQCLQQFNINQSGWNGFIATTLQEYHTELYASRGSLSNPDEIKYIQEALNTILGKQLKADGFWGTGSQNALIEFQRKFGLTPDGTFGAKTRAALERQFDKMSVK